MKGSGKIIQVESSQESSYLLFDSGEIGACGRNDEGQLGDGTFLSTSKKNPIVTVDLAADVRKLGSGPSSQSVFFIADGDVYAAGANDRFQLGIDEVGSQELPVRVLLDGYVDIAHLSSSGTHTVASGHYVPTAVSAGSFCIVVEITLLCVQTRAIALCWFCSHL